MNALTVSEAPSRSTDSQWWPDLFVRNKRTLFQVTPEKLNALAAAIRTRSSEWKDIPIYSEDGNKIGRVSFNGRVWLRDIEGEIEIPVAGRLTAKEQASVGWGRK